MKNLRTPIFTAVLPGCVNHVHLQYHVVIHEISQCRLVGNDTTHFGSSQKDIFRFFFRKKLFNSFPAVSNPILHEYGVIIFVYPCRCSSRTMADPTIPRCPATYIFAFLSIILQFLSPDIRPSWYALRWPHVPQPLFAYHETP